MWVVVGIILLFAGLNAIFGSNNQNKPAGQEDAQAAGEQDAVDAIAASMTVAVHCALIDGNLDNREMARLRRWKQDFIGQIKPDFRPRLDEAMEAEIQSSLAGVSEQRLHQAGQALQGVPAQFRAMTMDLCFEIVAADQRVEATELACLRKVARLLGTSDESFARLEEKHLRPIQLATATSAGGDATDQERLLGIEASWTKEQKLAQLTKEFAKYNARMQAVTDEGQRAQCRRMLEIIANLREELITGRKPTPPPPPGPAATPRTPTPKPAPSGSRDEILVGVDPALSPRQKLSCLATEEERWKGRLANQLSATAKAKCEASLQAIRRLRNVYESQL